MTNITLLVESEIRQCVGLDLAAVAAVRDAFTQLSGGEAVTPPVMRVDIPEYHGEVDVKTAYLRGRDSFAIKIASGFFENYRLGLPSGSGLMVLVSAETGVPKAVLLDNGYLTNVRTGAAGAVAADCLARDAIGVAGVIGSGAQARFQILGLSLVRKFESVMVYSTRPANADRYVAEMQPLLGVEVVRAKDAEQVVRSSDVVVTTTPSRQPYLPAEWLHPGLHITAMGSDAEDKQELYAAVLAQADRLVCDLKAQCLRIGELHHALEEGVLRPEDEILELGDLTSGRRPGRRSASEVTVCDLTGVGVQDTAIALLAYERAMQAGFGLRLEL